MPNCFQLTLKGQDKAALLSDVDEALCKHLGVEVHPTRYVYGWYNSIGCALACGKDWDWMRQQYQARQANDSEDDYSKEFAILDYLEANYTAEAWYAHG